MYCPYFKDMNVVVLVSICSLVSLVVGLLVGWWLSSLRKNGTSSSKPSRKPIKDGLVELYIGNLSYDVTQNDLAKAFERFGKVASIRVIKNRFSDKSKGFGFVQMVDRAQSAAAIRALNGSDIKGRRIVVNEARSNARSGDK